MIDFKNNSRAVNVVILEGKRSINNRKKKRKISWQNGLPLYFYNFAGYSKIKKK